MRYLPKSPADREAMLAEIGVDNIDALFTSIPEEYRLTRDLNIPRQHAESEVLDRFRAFAANVADGDIAKAAPTPLYASFLGAGAYRHYRPVVIDSLVQRGEFLTSYTPYQPEIAQGTLQATFEFQTMICELTGMEIANASMYDGSTGVAEAVLMAVRVTGRSSAVVARSLHPEFREVLKTTVQHQEIGVAEAGFDKTTGRVDMAALEAAITPDTACVVIGSPNFFGVIEDVAAVAELVHSKGALLVVSINEALSLGVVKPPSEADIVILEAQSFGVAVGFGGPYCGVLACKEKFLRQMPGRLCGETKDMDGKRGFVLTLSTREQHIRREKATSNICTNQALVSLMVTIYMTVMGKQGMKELGEQNLAKASYLDSTLRSKGAKRLFTGPSFNEFAVALPASAEETNAKLLGKRIIGGLSLAKWYPELGEGASLWCATELTTKVQMDAVAESL